MTLKNTLRKYKGGSSFTTGLLFLSRKYKRKKNINKMNKAYDAYINKDDWEILCDPTGMAKKTLNEVIKLVGENVETISMVVEERILANHRKRVVPERV